MLLNVWESIREFFKNIFNNVMWQNIFFLIGGIIVGILLGFLIYYIFFKINQKNEKKNNKEFLTKEVANQKSIEVLDIIDKQLVKHMEATEEYGLGLKIKYIFSNSMLELMRTIAGIYYPKTYEIGLKAFKDLKEKEGLTEKEEKDLKSKVNDVLFEVSMDDLIKLINTISIKLDGIINSNFLTRKLKNVEITKTIEYFEKRKAKNLEKSLKKQNKPKSEFGSKIKSFFFNTIGNKVSTIANKLVAEKIFNMIGVETAKVYSRGTFTETPTVETIEKNNDDIEVVEAK